MITHEEWGYCGAWYDGDIIEHQKRIVCHNVQQPGYTGIHGIPEWSRNAGWSIPRAVHSQPVPRVSECNIDAPQQVISHDKSVINPIPKVETKKDLKRYFWIMWFLFIA